MDGNLERIDREAINGGLINSIELWRKRLRASSQMVDKAFGVNLHPTPYAVEALAYWHRAAKLQKRQLGLIPSNSSTGDKLMDSVPIYDTVQRRYAGFSNVLEQLRYGVNAPKIARNIQAARNFPRFAGGDVEWMYVCLVHRLTGSGASFEHDHGWRNTLVPQMAARPFFDDMTQFVFLHPGPCFTSIGNQTPAFPKKTDKLVRTAGQQYIADVAPELVKHVWGWLNKFSSLGRKPGIKDVVDEACRWQVERGYKRFMFCFTAWAMDLAEYLPRLVNPNSDVYHGANAREAMEVCFRPIGVMTKQEFYDRATRVFSDITGTHPMDVEDAAPGCDLIRWLENYLPKNGYTNQEDKIWNSSSLRYHKGRQRP